MSFFDDASLAFLPSGAAGKDGKAYSIKPTDGTGDFTFSRGSNLSATRVGADGLIEKGRENLLTYSNQFDTTWVTQNLSVTSGQSGYDGTNDAWLLNITGGSCCQYYRQTISTSGVKTFSMYVKSGTLDGCLLFALGGANPLAEFDLATGSTAGLVNNAIDSSIEDVGGGWYRCSITFNENITQVRIYPATAAGAISNTSGNILIQDAQLEIGLAATPYIESGATKGKAGLLENEPRFDYSGGATCPSLLLEPSRTQLVGYSEYKEVGDFVNSTPSYNATSSPEGLQNATEMFDNSTNGQHRVPIGSFSVTSGTDYTISAFVKNNDIGYCYLLLEGGFTQTRYYFNLSTGQPITSGLEVENFANGWYRIYVTQSAASTGTGTAYLNMSNNGVSPIYAGSNQSLYFYGLQAEQGSYPTSYIPNHSGGTITRGADAASVTGVSSLIGQTEGTLYSEVVFIEDGTQSQWLSISDGTSQNWIFVGKDNDEIRGYVRASNSVIFSNQTFQIVDNAVAKIAIAYKSDDIALYINGTKISSSTDSFSFDNTLDRINFRTHDSGATKEKARHKKVLVFKERLSDADCITLTTI